MALGIRLETEFGIIVDPSYAKISYLEGNKDKIRIELSYYKDKYSFEQGYMPLKSENYIYVPNLSDNYIKQGYEYLKTLDKFANATDILEEGQ